MLELKTADTHPECIFHSVCLYKRCALLSAANHAVMPQEWLMPKHTSMLHRVRCLQALQHRDSRQNAYRRIWVDLHTVHRICLHHRNAGLKLHLQMALIAPAQSRSCILATLCTHLQIALSCCSCSGVRRTPSRSAPSVVLGHLEPGLSGGSAAQFATSAPFRSISAFGKPLRAEVEGASWKEVESVSGHVPLRPSGISRASMIPRWRRQG